MTAKIINAILNALPVGDVGMTLAALARAVGEERTAVSQSCCRLVKRRLIERIGTGRYRLTATGRAARDAGGRLTTGPNGPHTGIRKPEKNTFRGRFWVALRRLEKATISELVGMAAVDGRDGEKADYDNARKYLRALRAFGIVVILPRREPGTAPTSNGQLRFYLKRDLGPLAPVVRTGRHEGGLWDPNAGEIIQREGVS